MIDTHTHLYLEHFSEDITGVVNRALDAGVERCYLPSINSKYNSNMLELEKKFPGFFYSMIGLHPCYVNDDYNSELEFVKNKIIEHDYKAVGEIGIDLFHEKKFLNQQIFVFEEQIKLALENDLPIVIHSRESFNEIYKILKKFKSQNLRGIFHCFTGDLEQAKKIIDLNFYIGIGGVITFKNGKIAEFLNSIPIEKLVLETDSPYLSPTPFRGRENAPKNIPVIAKYLFDFLDHGLPENDFYRTIYQNSIQLFNLD